MFALIAALAFGVALILELIDERLGDVITPRTMALAGLLLLALHLAAPGRRRFWRR